MDIVDPDREWRPFGFVFLAVPVAMVINLLFTRPEPSPPNSVVYGCWVAASAPAILFDPVGLHIMQSGVPSMKYRMEWDRTWIIRYSPALILRPARNGSSYFVRDPTGLDDGMIPAHVVAGQVYGVREADQIQFIETETENHQPVHYYRATGQRCRSVS